MIYRTEKFFEFAACPEDTERIHKEKPHEFRDDFHRDRDRILYSSDFRRLSGKTQVFFSGFDDNMHTRLTHTLEVSQIAQTICDTLGLNNALCEAIALGRDVGHTSFGHVGERTLNLIMNSCLNYYNYSLGDLQNLGFKHNLQGIRVVTELEKNNDNYRGINLTKYTLWGIAHHSSLKYRNCDDYSESSGKCQYKNCNKCKNTNSTFKSDM